MKKNPAFFVKICLLSILLLCLTPLVSATNESVTITGDGYFAGSTQTNTFSISEDGFFNHIPYYVGSIQDDVTLTIYKNGVPIYSKFFATYHYTNKGGVDITFFEYNDTFEVGDTAVVQWVGMEDGSGMFRDYRSYSGTFFSWVNQNIAGGYIQYTNEIIYSNFSISASDFVSGSTINNFSILMNGTIYNTTIGTLTTPFYYNDTSLYNITFFGEDFANRTYEDVNISSNLEAELYSKNSVIIYAFDSDSGSVIEDFNISLLSGSNYYENTSSDNYTYFPTILSGEYIVSFEAENYSSSNYILTLADNSYQVLNIYANANATLNNVIFNVYDTSSGSVLESVLITQKKIFSGSYVVVESKFSDISGRAEFTYYEDIPYYFVASKEDYADKEFSLTPLFESYNVMMSPSITENPSVYTDDVVVSVEDYSLTNGTSFIYTSFFSPAGSLEDYSVNVTLENGTSYIGSDNIAVGSYINVSFSVPVVDFGDSVFVTFTYKSTLNSGERTISRVYLFDSYSDIDGGLSSLKDSLDSYSNFERIFWGTIIILSLASLFSVFGFASGEYFVFACVGGIIGVVLCGVLGLFNWVVSGLVIFLLLLFVIGRVING